MKYETYEYVEDVVEKIKKTKTEYVEKMVKVAKTVVEKVRVEPPSSVETMVTASVGPVAGMLVEAGELVLSNVTKDHEGSVLATMFNDPAELAEHKNAIPDKVGYEYPAITLGEFINYARGKSLEELQSDHMINDQKMPADSKAQGPLYKYRYIVDPNDPNRIIDMRHFLVVGPRGEGFGLAVEVLQLSRDNNSSFDSQDFFSNATGSNFFKDYDHSQEFTTQLVEFFQKRSKSQ